MVLPLKRFWLVHGITTQTFLVSPWYYHSNVSGWSMVLPLKRFWLVHGITTQTFLVDLSFDLFVAHMNIMQFVMIFQYYIKSSFLAAPGGGGAKLSLW